MKNFSRVAFFALAVVLLIGCGGDKEDPKPEISTSKLVGAWTVVSSQTEMSIDGKSYKQYLIDVAGISEEEADIYNEIVQSMLTLSGYYAEWEFKSDYTWTGDSDFVATPVIGTWDLTSDEKTLTLTNKADPGVTQTGTITKLTDTELWVEIAPNITQQPFGAPGNVTYIGIIKSTRKK